jgi:hypothetical protein
MLLWVVVSAAHPGTVAVKLRVTLAMKARRGLNTVVALLEKRIRKRAVL